MDMCRPDYKEWEYKVCKALRSLFWKYRTLESEIDEPVAKDTMMMEFLFNMLHRLKRLRDEGKIRQINKTVNPEG